MCPLNDTQTSDTLIQGLRTDIPAAWKAVYNRYRAPVVGIVMRMGLDFHSAEDVFQEMIVKQSGGKILEYFKEKGRLRNWLITSAKGIAHNKRRQQRRMVQFDFEGIPDEELDFWFSGLVDESAASIGAEAESSCCGDTRMQLDLVEKVRKDCSALDWERFVKCVVDKVPARTLTDGSPNETNAVYQSIHRVRRKLRILVEAPKVKQQRDPTLMDRGSSQEMFERLKFAISIREILGPSAVASIVWAEPHSRINFDSIKIKPLGEHALVVGRGSQTGWSFPDDKKMSDRHFSIQNEGHQFFVIDMGSTNGTYRNHFDRRRMVQKALLNDGDVISAGRQKFVFVDPTAKDHGSTNL